MGAPQPRYPSARAWVPLSCWAEDLVGGRGAVRVLVSWTVLVLLTGMALVAGLYYGVLIILGLAAALLVHSAGRSWYGVVMIAVTVLGTAALLSPWIAYGVASDAVDAPTPSWALEIGASLVVALGCAVAFTVTAALSLRHRRAAADRSG